MSDKSLSFCIMFAKWYYLSCARVWVEKLCKAREKSINLFNCFSEPQPILCKSDDLMGVFNSCWVFGRAKNPAFTNQSGEDTNLIGECGREPQRNL